MSVIINDKQGTPADILLDILNVLPPQKAAQLIDFARFLEAQQLNEELMQENDPDMSQDNANWDNLLSGEKSQTLLAKLAQEALGADWQEITFDEQGRLTPK